jgi:2-acylglycerol O-acyltransferase 2
MPKATRMDSRRTRFDFELLSGFCECLKFFFQVVLLVGGVREMFNVQPGVYKLFLKKRKGFVRLALETGASLVPVFSFNEVEMFNQRIHEPGSRINRLQLFFLKHAKASFFDISGRGLFGWIPFKTEITTVVGDPINVFKKPSPTVEEVDELHRKFIEAVRNLFDFFDKWKYIANADKIKLEFE